MRDPLPLVNKTVKLRFRGQDLSFELSHALFSSFDIDTGSRLLLKAVSAAVDPDAVRSIVDIGSGVGVLGIACAKAYAGASLTMRDRDALACAFSERNARLNKITPASVDHALFLDGLSGREFDLVLCNVPAKAGPPVLDRFFASLGSILSPGGSGAVVVVNPIADAALASLKASGALIRASERGAGHLAVVFSRPEGDSGRSTGEPWLAACERTSSPVKVGRGRYEFKGYWGLPEFDTPSFSTSLAIESFDRATAGLLVRRVLAINPGVGRSAAHAAARLPGAAIDLCGRDALALAASAANVAAAGCREVRQAAFEEGLEAAAYDLVVAFEEDIPGYDSAARLWETAARTLKLGGTLLTASGSTAADRIAKRRPEGFSRLFETRKKGYACCAWRKEK